MNTKYVPILRWKTGEKNCLEHLDESVTQNIVPFIEVSTPSDSDTDKSAEKKYNKLISSFSEVWKNKPFYLYLTDEWYSLIDDSSQIPDIYENFYNTIDHSYAIPAFDLSDIINITNVHNLSTNGVCLRISGNEFEALEETLSSYIDNDLITPQTTDLLLDLKFIDDDIYPKKAALSTVIGDISNISEYRSIIISSCSFPKDVSALKTGVVNELQRYEIKIHDISLKLQKTYIFNYVYSDYGPQNLNEINYIPGMSPNYKVKYTTEQKYLVVKGISLKKGGLDLVNVSKCCKLIVNHPSFSGEDFSYGDSIIYDTANSNVSTGGNLTSWVGYSLNHHITFINSIL